MSSLTESQLDRLSAIIAQRTGLNTFGRNRARLIEVLGRQTDDVSGYAVYLEMLGDNHPVWQKLLAELTVGETYFLRNSSQIDALRSEVLPELIRQKRRNSTPVLRLWSAGCATGEEAYTLAMLVHEQLPDHEHWDVQVLGTDLNDAALDVARAGHYREWSFRATPAAARHRYFVARGDDLEVRRELRQMVRFKHSNLITDSVGVQDLIVCRNVLIYFTRQMAEMAEANLLKSLRLEGWLLLSPVETLRYTRSQYRVHRFGETLWYCRRVVTGPLNPTVLMAKRSGPAGQVAINPAFETNYRRAVLALHRGQLQEALAVGRELLESRRDRAAVHSLVASILIGLGEREEARQHLVEALKADILHADAHYLMALVHLEADDLEAVHTALRAAIYSRPDFALAHLLRGDVYWREGNNERAERAWATARRLVDELPSDVLLSDVADVTGGQLVTLVDNRLAQE